MEFVEKPRVLLVDDDLNLLKLMADSLERSGLYEIRTEHRSARALTAAHAFRPSIILLDVDMPGMDGGEVARAVKSDPLLKNTPILFCTSLIPPGETGSAPVRRGEDMFVAKPISGRALLAAVESRLAAATA